MPFRHKGKLIVEKLFVVLAGITLCGVKKIYYNEKKERTVRNEEKRSGPRSVFTELFLFCNGKTIIQGLSCVKATNKIV